MNSNYIIYLFILFTISYDMQLIKVKVRGNALVTNCLAYMLHNSSQLIAQCRDYIRPEMNISTLVTRPPDGYFKINERNLRRKGRSVSRCPRAFTGYNRFGNITSETFSSKIKFCMWTLSFFINDLKKGCAGFDSSVLREEEKPCFKGIIDRTNQISSRKSCASVLAMNPDLKPSPNRRKNRLIKRSKDGCYYAFNDVFAEDTYRCLNAAVGIAKHAINACLDWMPVRPTSKTTTDGYL